MSAVLRDLETLSSAEEFFAYFHLDYDPRILAASRFHILKRFRDNIAALAALDEMNPAEQRAALAEELRSAYADYLSGPALAQGAFPALERIRGAFVPLV